MTDLFTADWHLDHVNIIKFCNRPFKDTEEMGRTIIKNINDVAGPNDRLFHLGDVTGGRDCYDKWLKQLVCQNLFLFPGNHDKNLWSLGKYFKLLPIPYGYYTYKDNEGFRLILHHHAMRIWPHSHHGAGHIYGHSHNTLSPMITEDGRGAMAFDVGVDAWDFKPVSLAQVKTEMKRLSSTYFKNGVAINDHHAPREK